MKCSNVECGSNDYKNYLDANDVRYADIEDIVKGNIKCEWCESKMIMESSSDYEQLVRNTNEDLFTILSEIIYRLNEECQ